ncbi:Not4hp Mot2p [Cryptosporidium sp. chipmunk genotype I]|uniref:Not4hp Mot2p n=1 Tax=Cryptosporidium sp. chipmunk genotype I TaxID=1280935 RepID=UPI00351A0545|nr:Not4hp Mot2p [Cryptosporidium sp. chipmunk genotype I]
MSTLGRQGPTVSNFKEKGGISVAMNRNSNKTQTMNNNTSGPDLTKVDYTCPLCMEEMDETDRKFFPCKCRYQICLWCFYHVRDQLDNKCPACRQQYENSLTSKSCDREIEPLSKDEAFNWCGNTVSRTTNNETSKAQSDNDNNIDHLGRSNDTSNLEDMRIIQRNLVYVVGLSYSVAKREILSCENSFGKYGKILNMRILPNNNDTCSAFITYYDELSATKAIKNINGKKMFGQNIIRCSFGTNKYCNSFIRNSVCNNPNCAYVHEIVDSNDCISKSELINFHSSNKFALKPLRELKQNAKNGQEIYRKDKKPIKSKGRKPYSNTNNQNYNCTERNEDEIRELNEEENEGLHDSHKPIEMPTNHQCIPTNQDSSISENQETLEECKTSQNSLETYSIHEQGHAIFQELKEAHLPNKEPTYECGGENFVGEDNRIENREFEEIKDYERVQANSNIKGGIQIDTNIESFNSINFGSNNLQKSGSCYPIGIHENFQGITQTMPSNIYYFPARNINQEKEEKSLNLEFPRKNSSPMHEIHMQKFSHPSLISNRHLDNHIQLGHAQIQSHLYTINGAIPQKPIEYIDHINQDNDLLELEIKNNIEKMIEETCEGSSHIQERQTPLIGLNSLENGQPFHSIFSNQLGQNCASNNRRTFSDVHAGIIQGIQNRDIREQINVANSSLESGINILRAMMPHANITIQGQ